MIVCENCIHRYVCEDKYTMKPQYACINYNSGKHIFIAKLEKIKEEILFSEIDNIEYITYSKALKHCCEIVDKHIAELKGENNDT